MTPPKISVVIPNLNCAEYLERTIQSVIEQDYPNIEIIMVDGGSTDGSLAIVERYRSRFANVVYGPDTGHANALNKGFAVSTGAIMCWINSDDVLMPGALARVGSLFQQHSRVSWIVGRTTLIKENGDLIRSVAPQTQTRIRFLCGNYQWVQQESTFWRRELWEAAGARLDESYRLAIDGELWLRFFQFERLYPVDAPLGSFRVRPGQRSEQIEKYHAEMLRAIVHHRGKLSSAYAEFFGSVLSAPLVVRSRDDANKLGDKIKVEDLKCITYDESAGVFINPNPPESPVMSRPKTEHRSNAPAQLAAKPPILENKRTNSNDITSFRDRHLGKRCVIMGNGPSLNKMDLSVFKDEIVFAANSIFLLFDRISWRPKYYSCVDTRVLPDISAEVERMHEENPDMRLFFPDELRIYDGTGRSLDTRQVIKPGPNRYFFQQKSMDRSILPHSAFSLDADDFLCTPHTVTITLMQLAYYMGFSEMYLIGCDTSYTVPKSVQQEGMQLADGTKLLLTSTKDDDPNHFDPRYFGKGRKWHSPKVKDMIFHYTQAAILLEECGTRVYNATVGGNLECFTRIDYRLIAKST